MVSSCHGRPPVTGQELCETIVNHMKTASSFFSLIAVIGFLESGPGWPESVMRIQRYDENSIHASAQPFNELKKTM